MFSENRSDNKEISKLYTAKPLSGSFVGLFLGSILLGKSCYRNDSKCLSIGLFSRNSLNQFQEKVSCLSFSYVFWKGNLKTTVSNA